MACFVTTAFFVAATAQAFSQAPTQSAKHLPRSKRARVKVHAANVDSQGSQTYEVRRGDSLYSIARRHGTSVGALRSANQLQTNRLKIGQSLRLPSSENASAGQTGSAEPGQVAREVETEKSVPAADGQSAADAVVPEIAATPEATKPSTVASTDEQSNAQSADTPQPLRVRLASMGIGLLGVRYRWNGNSEISGFDCSGLVKSLFDKFNISLPRTSREQYKVGERVDKDKLEVGDLVFFTSRRGRTPSHVGIYIGDNQFLHAARKARRVIISNLSANWYTQRFLGARRLADLWGEEPPPSEDKPDSSQD